MKSVEQILTEHELVNKGYVEGSLVNVVAAVIEYAKQVSKEQCLDFGLHLENMPMIKKFTVHPPDGSGGGTGLYEKTIEHLYNDYKKQEYE